MMPVLDGVFNIDKAGGLTSMDVVRRVKRISSQRRVGHGGTLDPMATGVLPVCMGQATRLMDYLVNGQKEYLATVRLGVTTDTYDAEGRTVEERDPSGVSRDDVEAALEQFRGTIQQTPPMYSALKRQGRRLHELARAGMQVELEPRTVEIMTLDMVDWQPPLVSLSIRCSRGMYVRSLAYDLGQALGCGAHLAELRRLQTGPFRADTAVTLERLEEAYQEDTWPSLFYPPDYLVLHLNAVQLSDVEKRQVCNGQPVALAPRTHYSEHMETCRAYSADGRFIALVRFNRPQSLWQPFKVLELKEPSPYSLEKALT